ncbi:hypothetical protein LguiA_026865 [Lonicera macranthoides]
MAIVRDQETSLSTVRYNYQVFLSFNGEDTRKTFTDHLYTALIQAGLRTFRDDDEIERGKRLELELRKAIQHSRISIIVLSKNYAFSKWCLDEVVMILKWSRISSHTVLPVFYDVDPFDVRNQEGSCREAFARYEEELTNTEIDDEKKKEGIEKVKGWKAALREVANLAGMVLRHQANGHEAKFIQEIVKEVESKLNRGVLHVARHLVGMHSRAQNINSWVHDRSSSEDILVICGMGGIGKTTIAKYVYNLNFQRFEGSSFLASVKEESERSNGLVNLQRQLLSNLLKGKKEEIYNVDEGIIKINEVICCKRVLVVIDDVDEVKQLDALLGTREFYPGSKIIITTRNKSLLKTHEVHTLHTVHNLSFYESLELFCWHAFGNELPDEGYKEQSERAVYRCGGLPLACEILASSLSGKSIDVWKNTLEKMEAIPEFKILNVLKISFDSLHDDHDKNLFLHIACFFVGHNKDEIIEILNKCAFFTMCGIQNLIDRCLISIERSGKIMMHQLLQEMGWWIVDQESPKEPWRRSRLWRPKDSFIVLNEKRGTEIIEGLVLDMQMYKDDTFNVGLGKKLQYDEFCNRILPLNQGKSFRRRYFNILSSDQSSDVYFNYDTFSRMDKLRLLKLNYAKLSGCCDYFPEGLRWLCWHGFPLKSIPFELPLGNLVSLDMSYSKLEHVWSGKKVLLSLKILNLSHCQRLVKTPNFTGLHNLERLILEGCISLVEVCNTIGNLKRLALLNLENCKSLPNVETLRVDGCRSLESVTYQGLYEFGIFNTFVRGEDIPSWCCDRNNNMGSSSVLVSFVVPSHPPGLRIPGLNVYCVYTLSNIDEIGHPNLLFTKIYNKTKDLKWIYTPVAIAIPREENEEEEFVWLSHWKFGNHLESGDEVDISVITSESLEVKDFGINLVWGGEQEEDMKANTHHHNNMEELIGGDLSNYQFMSPQAFLLCHHYMLPFFTKTAATRSWFQQLWGSHVTYEGTGQDCFDGMD